MINKVQNLLASEGFRQSSVMIFGNLAAVSMSALAMILISRSLGPAQFGEFSVGFALVLILARISDLGLTNAQLKFIPTSKTESEKNNIFSLAIQFKLIVSLLILIVGWLLTPWLTALLNFQQPLILYISFAANLATVLYEQLAVMLQSLHRVKQAVNINAVQAATKLTAALGLFLVASNATVPAYALYVLAPLAPVVFAQLFLPTWWKLSISSRYKKEEQLIKSMASHAAIGFMAAGVIENIDVLFVQGYLNEYETGLLAGASRIAMLVSLAGYSLANVLNPRVARYTDLKHFNAYFKKAILIALGAVVLFVVSLPVSGLLIRFTIGDAYLPATNILQILLASSFLTLASVPFIAMFFSFKRADWYFSISGILQMAIMIFGNWWYVPVYGVAAAAWTRVATKVFLFGFTVAIAWHYARKLQSQQLSRG